MEKGYLHLGKNAHGETIKLPQGVLKRHVAILGASGSGKTVMGKVLIEEAALNGIPSIIVDPQGDLASLAIVETLKNLGEHKYDKGRRDAFKDRVEVRVFTPASSKGIQLSVNPLKFPEKGISQEEMVRALDLTATGLSQLLGYTISSDSGKSCQKYLYTLLWCCWTAGTEIANLHEFSQLAMEPELVGFKEPEKIISTKLRRSVATKITYLSMGMDELLFNFGSSMDINTFLTPVVKGKIPVNIIYLNTLTSAQHKQFFVAMLAKELYTWMLQNPSDGVQLIFYIDEVGPYLPPHPYNPPSKEMINLLFKQGRKYGVSCFMCTQNPADVEYKAMAQANTLGFGRMITKQDLNKIKHILKSSSPDEAGGIIASLPSLSAGEFILVSPDVYKKAQPFQSRWLYTQHLTLDEEHIRSTILNKVLESFDKGGPKGKRVPPVKAIMTRPPQPETTEVVKKKPSGGRRKTHSGAKPPAINLQVNPTVEVTAPVTQAPAPTSASGSGKVGGGQKDGKPKRKRRSRKKEPSPAAKSPSLQKKKEPEKMVFSMGARKKKDQEPVVAGSGSKTRKKTKVSSGKKKAKEKFSRDLTDTSLISEMKFKLSQAQKLAQKVMKGRSYQSKTNLGGGTLVLLPLWSVRFTRMVKRPIVWFLPFIKVSKEEERGLFFSAENGELLQLADTISFSNEAQGGRNVRDFDELVNFHESSNTKLPAKLPGHNVKSEAVARIAQEQFQVNPDYMKFALLPTWEFEVKSEEGKLEERIYIDATLGKVVVR